MTAAVQVALAAVLVAICGLSARRWGDQVAGVASALPAIAGPFLLLVAEEHGLRAAATAANGTLAGLLALSGFAVAYTQTAHAHAWPVSLAAGCTVAAALTALVALLGPPAPLGVVIAVGSLLFAWRLMPATEVSSQSAGSYAELLTTMVIAALLVFLLGHAVGAFGAQLGGALAGVPVVAGVLTVHAHHRRGANASTVLMRGMLEGMAGFVVFCETVAVLAMTGAVALAFCLATAAALAVQLVVISLVGRPSRTQPSLSFPPLT